MTVVTAELGTRAVLRHVIPGQWDLCPACGKRVMFQARRRNQRVIANVYENGRWNRVEQWHPDCYAEAGEPHGAAA